MDYMLSRKVFFNCGYLSQQEQFVGKNFMAKIYVKGPLDPINSMIVNLIELKDLLTEATNQLDHKFLNQDVDFFQHTPPSINSIASYLLQTIQQKLQSQKTQPPYSIFKIKLYENSSSWVEVYG